MPDQPVARPSTAVSGDDDRISFQPVFAVVWKYKRRLGLALLSAATLMAAGAILMFLMAPTVRVGSLSFRLLFAGAEKGVYPNNTKFSTAEITAPPVLAEVYKANELQKYLDYPSFKQSLFVLQSNPDLELLAYEYQAKLADSRLTAVDRSALEQEFEKKRESLESPDFTLNFRHTERTTTVPRTLVHKVLTDTLAEWARVARDQKGALEYDIAVLSKNILQRQQPADEDFFVTADILRTKINRILANVDKIAALPSAALVRTTDGSRSLAEVRLDLEEVVRFEIIPTIRYLQSGRASRNPQMLKIYVDEQLRQMVIAQAERLQRVRALQEPLRDYVSDAGAGRVATPPALPTRDPAALGAQTLIPQLGESFLQQLVQMAKQNNDTEYRQELTDRIIQEGLAMAALEQERLFYEGLSRTAFEAAAPAGFDGAGIEARLKRATAVLQRDLDGINDIYGQLSAKNLDPGTLLFTVTLPYAERTERSLLPSKVAMFGLVGLLFAAFLLVLAAFAHHYYQTSGVAVVPLADASGRGV